MSEMRPIDDVTGPLPGAANVSDQLYEIRAEPDEGFTFTLGNGAAKPKPWKGVRIRYRPLGSRGRFRSFLLEMADGSVPSIAQMQEACRLHEERC